MSEILELFATAATADRVDAGVGIIWFAKHPPGDFALTVIDYFIYQTSEIDADWVGTFFKRSAELVTKHQPATRSCMLRVEHLGLVDVLKRANEAFRDTQASKAVDSTAFDIRPIKDYESAKWPATLDERCFAIRPQVDSGKVIRTETGLRRFNFRAMRTNHLKDQIKRHRPGDAASAGELLQAFVLGVLLGTTPKRSSFFDACNQPRGEKSSPANGPFGSFVRGRRPL